MPIASLSAASAVLDHSLLKALSENMQPSKRQSNRQSQLALEIQPENSK